MTSAVGRSLAPIGSQARPTSTSGTSPNMIGPNVHMPTTSGRSPAPIGFQARQTSTSGRSSNMIGPNFPVPTVSGSSLAPTGSRIQTAMFYRDVQVICHIMRKKQQVTLALTQTLTLTLTPNLPRTPTPSQHGFFMKKNF